MCLEYVSELNENRVMFDSMLTFGWRQGEVWLDGLSLGGISFVQGVKRNSDREGEMSWC